MLVGLELEFSQQSRLILHGEDALVVAHNAVLQVEPVERFFLTLVSIEVQMLA